MHKKNKEINHKIGSEKTMYYERFIEERDIKKSTVKGYRTAVKKYTEYYNMTLEELIDEAIQEEDDKIPKRRRTIKQRLLKFRTHLVKETDLEISTIRGIITKLTTIYNYFEVDVPDLPKLKDNEPELTYLDLPNKKHIKQAIQISGVRISSLILFMASSGSGRSECANLKVKDFIQACEGYYTEAELMDILDEMDSSIEPIVPTFNLVRIKTQKSYYTFCTPEATNAIIEWLILKNEILEENGEKLTLEDSVWDLTPRQMNYHFQIINDTLDWGFKKKFRFFRPHTLRKFHASNIGLSAENVDFLQGRSKDRLHATYIKANPDKLKQVYVDVMDNVTIGGIDKKEIIHEDFTININLNFYGKDYGVSI